MHARQKFLEGLKRFDVQNYELTLEGSIQSFFPEAANFLMSAEISL